MKVARRRFFGLAAAPAIAKAAPAAAVPVVEMVEADIAPVASPVTTPAFWYYCSEYDNTINVIQSDMRKRVIDLTNKMDAELRAALIFGEKQR